MKMYGSFEKIEPQDDGTIKVWGIASSEAVDGEKEIIKAEAMKSALPDYMEFANVREMHGKVAAGVCFEASVDPDGKTRIGAHIVDPVSVKKVQTNVLKGFSIGGAITSRDPEDQKIITGVRLSEISLVDRPCNPDARITLWKGEGFTDEPSDEEVRIFGAMLKKFMDAGLSFENVAKRVADLEEIPPTIDHKGVIKAWKAKPEDKDLRKAACESRAALLLANPKAERVLKSLAILAGDQLEKGLWTVSRLAELIGNLFDIQSGCAMEAAYEGDASTIPMELAESIKGLGEILGRMVDEELGELFEEDVEIVQMAAKIDELAKRGATHSAATMGHLKSMHDHLQKMTGGSVCAAEKSDVTADVIKSLQALPAALAKALGAKETDDLPAKAETLHKTLHETQAAMVKITEDRETLHKALEEAGEALNKAAAEIERLKAEPAPGGPVRHGLHIVAKTDDGKAIEGDKPAEDGKPVVQFVKADGTPDEVRSAVHKALIAGGKPFEPIAAA